MVMSIRSLFVQFSIIGIFLIASITFISQMQSDNDTPNSILENQIINKSVGDFTGNLTAQRDTVQGQKNAYDSEIPERGFGSLLVFSIVTVSQKFTSGIVSTYNIMIVLPASVLGISEVVIATLTSILLVTIVLLGWRVIRVGS